MAWVLGIDTASTQLDIGLVCDGAAACSYSRFLAGSHAEHISETVQFLLKSNRIEPQDIADAGVTVGPGSFTGLRIGIAFIKGFFLTRQARVLPVSSLEAVARAWPAADGPFAVAFEARRGKTFCARFYRENGTVRRISADSLETPENLAGQLQPGEYVLIDALGYRASALAQTLGKHARVHMLERQPVQRGLAAACMAWDAGENDGGWLTPAEVTPRYLQESWAEEKALKAAD